MIMAAEKSRDRQLQAGEPGMLVAWPSTRPGPPCPEAKEAS